MIINVLNKKTAQLKFDYKYIGRGPGKAHMLTPGMKPRQEGWLGNPVVVGQQCPNCGMIHNTGRATLMCFSTLFQAKLILNAEFREEMESWRDYCLGPRNDKREMDLVCWCSPDPCHGDIIAGYLSNVVGSIGFTRFIDVFAWMSNMSQHLVNYDGYVYQTSEHAYMCQKTLSENEREKLRDCNTPEAAKKLGRSVTLRSDWEEVKATIMQEIVEAKVRTNPVLKDKLLATGYNKIYELTWWHDRTWGICSCETHQFMGQNLLGHIWEKTRDKIRKDLISV